MCLIDGEKYTSRAQSNTLKYFFQPDRLLRPSTHGKGLASAKICSERKKILKNSAEPLVCIVINCGSKWGLSSYFHGVKIDSPKFF